MTTNDAFITVFRPAKANGAAAVICPGGGYGVLMTEPEGINIARWLNLHGITGIVLEYRLPAGIAQVPLLDAQRAMRLTRSKAQDWGIDPHRIGIIGFSAGGHLASLACTHFDSGESDAPDPMNRFGCRPDFALLIYPVITMGAKTHPGSRTNLLGPSPTGAMVKLFSSEDQVTAQTPPAFLAHAADDQLVSPENSQLFYEALLSRKIPALYLKLPSGGHGLNGYHGPMWDAWQFQSLKWLASLEILPEQDAADPDQAPPEMALPDFAAMSNGPMKIYLLPGQHDVVFSMYGAPGELDQIAQLVSVMRERKLGNGFDPGPSPQPDKKPVFDYLATVGWPVVSYSGGEMQIQGGRSVFGRDNEAILAPLDRAGVFSAVQLGEWGYYFHNLAPNPSWWHDVYGQEFESFKRLMKPAGLAGYNRRPSGKKECYDAVKDYFISRSRDLLGRVISVTGHSHYEAYAGEWGASCIGLEVGENIAFTQSKLAFARGASRQWRRPWSVQVSPWFNGACTTSGPLRREGQHARGLDAGHSLSFYERMWLHAWFAGAALVTPENSIATFFEKPEAPWTLTAHGRKASEIFTFMQTHDRGVPYTPVAIVLDHLAGYNAYMDKPWGILTPTPGDRMVRDLFDFQLFPGSDHIHSQPYPDNPELSYLRATPYGEVFDVLLTSVPPDILPAYPVILLAGDIDFDPAFVGELEKSLRRGSRVMMSESHRNALGDQFQRVTSQGNVEVLGSWTDPTTGRAAVISSNRLAQLTREWLPIEISGDPIEYELNRNARGWVVELINNNGVVKYPDQPAVTNPAARAHVTLRCKVPCVSVQEWRSQRVHPSAETITVEVGPGASEFVEFTLPH